MNYFIHKLVDAFGYICSWIICRNYFYCARINYFVFFRLTFLVPRNNHINFGDCSVLHSSCQSFTLTNHAEADVIRFSWEPPPQLTFSPCAGHLLPNCAKDIKVTFQSPEPVKLESVNISCKIIKIQLAKKVAKVNKKIPFNCPSLMSFNLPKFKNHQFYFRA